MHFLSSPLLLDSSLGSWDLKVCHDALTGHLSPPEFRGWFSGSEIFTELHHLPCEKPLLPLVTTSLGFALDVAWPPGTLGSLMFCTHIPASAHVILLFWKGHLCFPASPWVSAPSNPTCFQVCVHLVCEFTPVHWARGEPSLWQLCSVFVSLGTFITLFGVFLVCVFVAQSSHDPGEQGVSLLLVICLQTTLKYSNTNKK